MPSPTTSRPTRPSGEDSAPVRGSDVSPAVERHSPLQPAVPLRTDRPAPTFAEGPNPLADATRHRRATSPTPEEAIARYRTKQTLGQLHPDCLAAYITHGFTQHDDDTITLKASPEHEARHYEAGVRHPTYDRIEAVTCSTTIAHGDDGHAAAGAPLLADRIANGTALHLEGLHHFGPLEDPARVAEAIASTLD